MKHIRRSFIVLTALAVMLPALVGAGTQDGTSGERLWFDDYGFQGEGPGRIDHLDAREGSLAPSAAQQSAAARLGATRVAWNDFGTPHVLIRHGGYLTGPRDGDATDVARAFVREHRDLFRLSEAQVADLEVLRDSPLYDATDLTRVYRQREAPRNPDVAHVVRFRQTFGDLHAAWDGQLVVGVQRDGRVAWVSSSTTGDADVSGSQTLDAAQAVTAAANDVGFDVGVLASVASPADGWTTFETDVVSDLQRARSVALPTPTQGVRRAWEVVLLKGTPDEHGRELGFHSFVDAETGKVWVRRNIVDHFQQDGESIPIPRWRVFPANPPFVTEDEPSEDTRVLWCWINDSEECDEEQQNDASRAPWDVTPPEVPSLTTDGNNATTAISHGSPFTPDTVYDRPPPNPSRDYDYAWANAWFEEKCNPTNFALDNDDNASVVNLFVMHNRMHDWSYFLGFTENNSNLQRNNFGNTGPERENDPEQGQAQAGRTTVLGRDNANQITPPDGVSPITNQYLWEPLAGAFYGTCTDGAYDMAIVAHEYMHAITNRMIGGPDAGTGDSQGQTESWSDLAFAEYYRGFSIVASEDANPLALAPYVTGNPEVGIRNYSMDNSPLNYSNLEYDGSGLGSPHSNGEIWSAVNHDIAVSLMDTYAADFPPDDADLQERCARGQLDAHACPGNRRWAQIMFDAFLIQPVGSSMVDSRDSMLAADMMRFDGANQDELWEAFARRGLGESAVSDGVEDDSPLPGWDSPEREDEAEVTFETVDAGDGEPARFEVYTGVYEARITPTADNDPETEDIGDTVTFVPGTYEFLVRADGYGAQRFSLELEPGGEATVRVPLRRNHASLHNGASASGHGVNHDEIIDDTETTNWASLSDDAAESPEQEGRQVEGRQVTVELADGPQEVTDVQVSAALRGSRDGEEEPDPGAQSRFSALRSFDVLTCDASGGTDCENDENFRRVLASADDAFDATRPRPLAPDLTLRPFAVESSTATHVRLRVRDNQCTGTPEYQGEANPVNDPVFSLPDCDTNETGPGRAQFDPPENIVRAAELQVFTGGPRTVQVDGDGVRATSTVDTETICPPGQVPGEPFGDIADNVHEDNIACIAWYEITTGVTEDTYEPGENVTRGQMASFMARLAVQGGVELPGDAPDAFDDDDTSIHEPNINALAALGLVEGLGDVDGDGNDEFGPQERVRRDQMAAFIARTHDAVVGQLPDAPGDAFDDDNGNTHEAAINALAALGVVEGRPDVDDADGDGDRAENVYLPGDNVLRAQMASFIIRELTLEVAAGRAFAGGADVRLDERSTTVGGTVTGVVRTRKQLRSLVASGCDADPAEIAVDTDGSFEVQLGDDQQAGSCELSLATVAARPGGDGQESVETYEIAVEEAAE